MATAFGAAHLVAWFREGFATDPGGVWHAPGRANLIGEHTDYNEGFVLPFALDRGMLAAAALTGGAALELRDAGMPDTEPDARVPGPTATPAPAAVAGGRREAGYPVAGARLAIDSDLPQGAGLSSSAALECATALALTQLHGIDVPQIGRASC